MKKDIAKIDWEPTPRDTQHQNIGHRKDPTTETTKTTKKEPNPAQDPIHTTRTTDATTAATTTTRK